MKIALFAWNTVDRIKRFNVDNVDRLLKINKIEQKMTKKYPHTYMVLFSILHVDNVDKFICQVRNRLFLQCFQPP